MQSKKAHLSVLLLAILAVGILSAAVPVRAAFLSSVSVTKPDLVVPGGGIELNIPYVSPLSDGGTIYFYFSKDDEATISSGDILLTSMKRTDVEAEISADDLITIFVPTTVAAGTYYVKVSDSSAIGASCKVSAQDVEVIPEEEWPTITVDPESGTVPTTVEVSGEDISTDYVSADMYWDDYEEWIAVEAVSAGEFTEPTAPIPEAFMGSHKILVLLSTTPTTLGTFVDFEVEPSVDYFTTEAFSIEADVLNQLANFTGHGFPKGTIDADSIKYIVKDFVTGETVDIITATHAEADVYEADPLKGTFDIAPAGPGGELLNTTVHYVPEGSIDLQFEVASTITLSDVLLSSATRAPGEFDAKMSATSGFVGDTVTFSAIGFPAGVSISIEFRGVVSYTFADTFAADGNGAWKTDFVIPPMTGGEYDIYIWDMTSSPARSKKIGTFEILPEVTLPASATVEELITIDGTGFPLDGEFDTIVIGTGEVTFDPPIPVAADGSWSSGSFAVPHTSGGGKEVTVSIKGVDGEGAAVSIESSIVIDPTLQAIVPADEEGTLVLDPDTGDWVSYIGATIFGGSPMRITGMGFLAGESVSLTFSSDTLDYEDTATITDGGTADSDGDLAVVFQVPTGLKFALGVSDWDIEVAGATATNTAGVYDTYGSYVAITGLDDALALLYFGLEADGDLDLTVNVGDEVRVVGCGFATKSLTLKVDTTEVKSVTAEYGYFDTTITIPELPGRDGVAPYDDPIDYFVTASPATSAPFNILSKVTLSPAKAVPGTTVTATGTGFAASEDTDIEWPGIPTLATATADSDGLWTETFTVPDVPPGTYTITFDAEGLPDAMGLQGDIELTFYVLGPLKIVSLSLPTTVHPEYTITVSVNVQDFFGMAVEGATLTGSITPPVGAAVPLTFTETVAGIYTASWDVPADAAEGTYRVDVTASKPEAGGDATASGTFYVEIPPPPPEIPPPVDISALEAAVADLSSDVAGLSGDMSRLASDVAGLKSDIAALQEAIAAIPVVPVEWIYITAIMAIIAAIAAIAAVVAVYRKIA